MNRMRSAVVFLLCLLTAGCQTVKTEPLQDFVKAPLAQTAASEAEGCMASAALLSEEAIETLFQTKKMSKGFFVCRLILEATGETDIQFTRNMMRLSLGAAERTPVDPASVAYDTRVRPAKGLYLLGGIGMAAALAASANATKTNDTMEMWMRREAIPPEGTIRAGASLTGFLYFEHPTGPGKNKQGEAQDGEISLSLQIRTGDKERVLTLANIPEIDVTVDEREVNHEQ